MFLLYVLSGVLYALSYLAGSSADPVQVVLVAAADLHASSSCDDLHHCRTLGNIVQSCLVTIALCSWVAIHPDIPLRKEAFMYRGYRRIMGTAEAALVPEWTIVWTIQQWLVARKLCNIVIGMTIYLL